MGDSFYPVSIPSIGPREIEYVTDAVESGWISSLGKYVQRFEQDFAAFCDVEHAVSVSNGTVAIHLALKALGIGAGDEVIIPDLSFIATANATVTAGATPIFCDIDAETLCIDPDKVEALITSRTKAIMPVHLYGHPANMTALSKIADKYGLHLIEDAAEAHGSMADGRRVGGLGTCGTFSFYGNKNFTTGEGGMVTTNDAEFAERCRLLRDHAMSKTKRYWHDDLGYNYRMTNLQAALGCAQLERADELLSARANVFEWYRKELADFPGIRLNRTAIWATNTYWVICVEIDGMTEDARETLMADLRGSGVDTRPYFYPMSRMPYLERAQTPVAHRISPTGLNLPTYVGLKETDVSEICGRFIETLKANGYV